MSRNLLPTLRRHPNPANIPQGVVGGWSKISSPADLSKLDFGAAGKDEVRTNVQSIPSPWARMNLFRTAFEADLHPARTLVEHELLDALELMWSSRSLVGVTASWVRVNIDDLRENAAGIGSERVDNFVDAIISLRPRGRSAQEDTAFAFDSIFLLLVNDIPVLGTSPYTGFFTSKDAAGAVPGTFFRYGHGGKVRRLRDRSKAFQRYVAKVILPQLNAPVAAPGSDVQWPVIKSTLKPWLEKEVRDSAIDEGSGQWEAAAEQQKLDRDEVRGGLQLFRKREGGQVAESRWLLRQGIEQNLAPLILIPDQFDGELYDGASGIRLPADLYSLERDVLPGVQVAYPWVSPEAHWFTDTILLLEQPLTDGNTWGFQKFVCNYRGDDVRLKRKQFSIPLSRSFFEHFAPSALDEMIKITVSDAGSIEVQLSFKVGPDDSVRSVTVKRVYDTSNIFQTSGPSLALWPSFDDQNWKDYALFRHDANPNAARVLELRASSGGRELKLRHQIRSDHSRVYHFENRPDVFEFLNIVHGVGALAESCGVILPKLKTSKDNIASSWQVGVDFGTSNTVVSVLQSGADAPRIFESDDVLLPITELAPDAALQRDSYFFPQRIAKAPFGTVVVFSNVMPDFVLANNPVALRVNIPFSGHVEGDKDNRVQGDLKWSIDNQSSFLTQSFLRHVAVTILAHARNDGVSAGNISFICAYPRSFSPTQQNQLRHTWISVMEALSRQIPGIAQFSAPVFVDESKAVLHYFYNAQQGLTSSKPTVVIDIGGGTSDIAVYGQGKALALDSAILGGRNLTGRSQGAAAVDQLRNPFVRALATWATGQGFDRDEAAHTAVTKYLSDGQDHLAFSYLITSEWFRENGRRFTGTGSFYSFQTLSLYFFASLFHYAGLSLRALGSEHAESSQMPHTILLAGNGSRYLHWLTDLTEDSTQNHFRLALARIFVRAAAGDPSQSLPRVEVSEHPKLEVALGLTAKRNPNLDESGVKESSLVGERISTSSAVIEKNVLDRVGDGALLRESEIHQLKWNAGEMEIERFHKSLQGELPALQGYGRHWRTNADTLSGFLNQCTAEAIQNMTTAKLSFVAGPDHEYRGSLLLLEMTAVLEKMASENFKRIAT